MSDRDQWISYSHWGMVLTGTKHSKKHRYRSIGEKTMRSIWALSLLVTLCASANAATVHHAHRRHAIPNQGMIASDSASGFAYAPPGPAIHYRAAPYDDYNEPYPGASQGYAPGEKEQFLDSVRQGG